ncbi:extracellular calcium-sensing receptor-like [Mixophyes fleayi]|uniref:extracellular calcium-sensing receptor-like n=1 Tax=Mixophyes fleayi TaxID=3061075 RepID=UPI003F4D8BBB
MDSCSDAKGALGGASWLLSGGPGGPLSYQCWGPPPRLAAVLGDAGEESALSLANVLGLYNYPQVSYFTPPAKLSNRFLFPSTLSVAPTVSSQAKGIARLLQVFGWSWVGVLSQETSASTLSQAFLEELVSSGACLAFWEKVPSLSKDVSQVAAVIRQSTANVVVVFSLEAYLNPVLVDLARNGDTRDRVWLSTDAWSTSPALVAPWLSHFLRGSLGLVLRNGAAPGFKEFVFGLHPNQYNNHPFFKEFWEKAFSCQWATEENHSSLFLPPPVSPNSPTNILPLHISPTFNTISVSSSVSSASSLNTVSPSIFLPATLPSSSASTSLCTGLEDPASLQIFSDINDLRVTYNVYKAVKMVAKALQDMDACRKGGSVLRGNQCVNMEQFEPWQVRTGRQLALDTF